jgi:hypothetical protein
MSMGKLNFAEEPQHLRKIAAALRRRGLVPDLQEEWEVHGPHEGMNFQVYVGYAVWKGYTDDTCLVAVSLHGPGRGVYELDSSSDWYKSDPERKIPVV